MEAAGKPAASYMRAPQIRSFGAKRPCRWLEAGTEQAIGVKGIWRQHEFAHVRTRNESARGHNQRSVTIGRKKWTETGRQNSMLG